MDILKRGRWSNDSLGLYICQSSIWPCIFFPTVTLDKIIEVASNVLENNGGLLFSRPVPSLARGLTTVEGRD